MSAPPTNASAVKAIAVVCVLLVGAWLLWPDSPTRIDDDQYDIAIALYRVCNQQDVEGLKQIDEKLPAGDGPLRATVDMALEGDWKAAMRQSRQILEDQVQPAR